MRNSFIFVVRTTQWGVYVHPGRGRRAQDPIRKNSTNDKHRYRMKRYCQTLELYNDKELIKAYVAEHAHVWDEVKAGIREVGIIDMQIYIDGNRLFMIMDTTDDFDMERDYARLATLPRQAEWEAHMAKYQKAAPGATSQEKWKLMDRIFKL